MNIYYIKIINISFMNYLKIYNNLIEKSKNRILEKYYEKHHIIPKCIGGDNINNIAKLTAKEHFIAHMLLCKIYPNNGKLLYALWRLINSKGKQGYKITARTYEKIKMDLSIKRSKDQKNKLHTTESKLKISLSQKNIPKSDNHKKQMSLNHCDVNGIKNPMYNKKHKDDSKVKMSLKAKLRIKEKNPFYGKHHKKDSLLKIQQTKINNQTKSKFKIFCYNNNKIYLSLRDIEKDLNINRKKASLCCKKIIDNVKNYKFEFL
jgi:hypothetical protein